MIYTSGSTGAPKGVIVTHQAVANFLAAMAQRLPLNSEDKMIAVTTVTFDMHVLELYLPLLAGASVVLADPDMAQDPAALAEQINRSGATIMQAPRAVAGDAGRPRARRRWSANASRRRRAAVRPRQRHGEPSDAGDQWVRSDRDDGLSTTADIGTDDIVYIRRGRRSPILRCSCLMNTCAQPPWV